MVGEHGAHERHGRRHEAHGQGHRRGRRCWVAQSWTAVRGRTAAWWGNTERTSDMEGGMKHTVKGKGEARGAERPDCGQLCGADPRNTEIQDQRKWRRRVPLPPLAFVAAFLIRAWANGRRSFCLFRSIRQFLLRKLGAWGCSGFPFALFVNLGRPPQGGPCKRGSAVMACGHASTPIAQPAQCPLACL